MSALHPFVKSLQEVCTVLAATLASLTLLAMTSVAVADSRLPALDGAERDLLHAVDQAMQAAPDKKALLATKFNSYSNGSIEACAPEYRRRQSRPDLPPIDFDTWLAMYPDKLNCIVNAMQEGTALFNRVTAEAKAGGVSPETLQTLSPATPSAPPANKVAAHPAAPATVNPWNGTGAKLDHAGDSVFLSYTDAAGEQHRYAVARPKMLQGMTSTGDTGSWAYVASDKSSGRMFQIGAGGDVQSNPLSAMQIKLFLGQ